MRDTYPEFSQFKELPAWGFYIRHAKGITFDNVKFIAEKPGDYRPGLVTDDVQGLTLRKVEFEEPGANGTGVHLQDHRHRKGITANKLIIST